MTILKVLHFPDERLRLKASPVKEITSEIKNIAENMLETMYTEGGIGLAATQVNIQKRIVVIDLSESKNKPIILINPEILKLEGKDGQEQTIWQSCTKYGHVGAFERICAVAKKLMEDEEETEKEKKTDIAKYLLAQLGEKEFRVGKIDGKIQA